MTFVDRRQEFRPETGEAPFRLDEVFFSRTNDAGIILSGNYIFKRVSNYDWEELLNKPHKIIRHPDMPRGLFWLIWDELKKGNPVGGYVKNRAKDGLYYWVFAGMMPFGDGYLSARIKPSCKTLAKIEPIYARMRSAERTDGLSPKDSAQMLIQEVQALGYDSYHQFMAQSLVEELLERDKLLGHTVDRKIANFYKTYRLTEELTAQTDQLIQQFDAMRTIPHNLRVIASRLEPTGGPVTTLSQNYGTMSREMSQWFETHVLGENSNFVTIKGSVQNAMNLSGLARLLHEVEEQLLKENRSLGEGISLGDECDLVEKIVQAHYQKCDNSFKDVCYEAERIANACAVMNRHVLGLSTTRVMCKIESARRPDAGEALNDIINQLMGFQDRIKEQLDRIALLGEEIQSLRASSRSEPETTRHHPSETPASAKVAIPE